MAVSGKLRSNDSWSSSGKQMVHQSVSSLCCGWGEHPASPQPGHPLLKGPEGPSGSFYSFTYPEATLKQWWYKTCLKSLGHSSTFSFYFFSLVKIDWFCPATGNVFLLRYQARGRSHSLCLDAWGNTEWKRIACHLKIKTKTWQEHLP